MIRQDYMIERSRDSHKDQDDSSAVTDVVHGSVIQGRRGIESWRSCGNHNGNASQEQQRAGRLVDCCAELLGVELESSDQETAPCMHSSLEIQQPAAFSR